MSYFPSVAFLAGSVGTGEWVVLFVVILIVVGPKRLPEIARTIGRTMEMFRRAADEFKDQIMNMDKDVPASPAQPAKTDADGVAVSGAASEGSEGSSSYEDAYPNMADYPGNEGHVENWHADATAEPLAERAPDGGPPGAPEGGAAAPHAVDEPGTPGGGGA